MVWVWTLHLLLLPFTHMVKPEYWLYFNKSANQVKLFAQAFDTCA